MSRRKITRRQWELVRALQGLKQGLRTVDLAERLECSPATVNRDLEELRSAGVPIERNRRNGEVRHRFDGKPLTPLAPTQAQYVALRLARAQLQPLEGTHLVQAFDELLDSLERARPQADPRAGESLGPAYVSQAPRTAPCGPILRTVDAALRSRRQLTLRYRAASHSGQEGTYRIDPLRLRWVDGDLYLCGYVPERAAARTFKVTRIVEAKLLRTRAAPHPRWTDERLFAGAVKIWSGDLVSVTIRLAPDVAHLAPEYPLVPDQRTELRPDRSLLLHARVAGLTEARRWLLSWGASAEALEPLALRQAMQQELEGALQPYTRKPPVRAAEQPRSPKLSEGGGTQEKRRLAPGDRSRQSS